MKDKDTSETNWQSPKEEENNGIDPVETLKNIAKRESEAAKKAVAEGGKRPNENEKIKNDNETNETNEPQNSEEDDDDDLPTLKEAIMEQATETDAPLTANLTFMKIIGGDIFNTSTIRKCGCFCSLRYLFSCTSPIDTAANNISSR